MDLLQHMTERARSRQRRVVLAEGNELRTLKAANRILAEGLAKVTLVGNPDEINAMAAANNLEAIAGATIVNPADQAVIDRYAPVLLELRKSKGMTPEQAVKTAANPLYLGCLIVKTGDADCMVAGAENTTGDVLRAAFQVIKTRPGIDVVSGAFLMLMPEGVDYGTDGIMIFADCAVVPDPDARQLAQIAVSSAETARNIAGIEPHVAMLSFSTKGSGKHERVDKVVEATKIAHEMEPGLDLDGELQADAALVPVVAAKKAPGSTVAGKANVLVFPSLEVGNIAYKLVQRIGGAQAIGPVLQGLAAPVNDLSRGASWEDIYKTIIMTCNQ
ncbi:MAG: phosphate acetyltransferase [Muribaculaceae bacterium]|nr:phosphate acetyltransferase [Muribaculaceae bacterium]